jgi:hypothetical protein
MPNLSQRTRRSSKTRPIPGTSATTTSRFGDHGPGAPRRGSKARDRRARTVVVSSGLGASESWGASVMHNPPPGGRVCGFGEVDENGDCDRDWNEEKSMVAFPSLETANARDEEEAEGSHDEVEGKNELALLCGLTEDADGVGRGGAV